MEATDDLRLLAYSVDVGRVRALELGSGYTREHDLGESLALEFPEWVDTASMRDWLRARDPQGDSGDVYARLLA